LSSLIRNALAVLGSDLANRASTFALYALVSRYLGEVAFGQMSLAQSTFYFFGWSVAGLGIRWFMAREMAKAPEKTSLYLGNGAVMLLATSLLTMVGIALLTLLSGYSAETRMAILLMSLTIVPYTMIMMLEGTFVGREKMHFIFLVNAPINVLNIAVTWFLLQSGASLVSVILVQVAAYTLIALLEWVLMIRFVAAPTREIRWQTIRGLVHAASAFSGIDVVIAVMATMQTYLISIMADERQVGLFNSANLVNGPLLLVLSSLIGSMLPLLTRQAGQSRTQARQTAARLIELLLWFSVPAAVGIAFVADDFLVLLYGREAFAEGGVLLAIIGFALIIRSNIQVLGNLLYATGNEQQNLRIVIFQSVVGLVVNILVIARWGAVGAAVANVVLTAVEYVVHAVILQRVTKLVINPLPLLWRSVLGTIPMALVLFVLPADLHVLLRVLIGGVVYAVAMGIVLLTTVGGPRQIKDKYLNRSGGSDPMTAPILPRQVLAEGD
jgi:O-antigen/teichoic acid export membrane protein